jgi:hypothetical protein
MTVLEFVLRMLLTTLQRTPGLVGMVDTIVSLTDFIRTEPSWLKLSCLYQYRTATDVFVLSAVDLVLYSVAGPVDGQALLDEGHVAHGGDHDLSKDNFVTMFQILKVDLPFG